MRNLIFLWLSLIVAAACTADDAPTELALDVKYDAAWGLERLDISVGPKQTSFEARGDVRLLLPDDMAGAPLIVKVDGVREGANIAHGEAEVTLLAGSEVRATITMMALVGPVCDAGSEDACEEVPEPMCISATTLRTATGPGTCVNSQCQYGYEDVVCENGCMAGACVCDSITELTGDVVELATVTVDRTFRVNGSAVPDTTVNGYGSLFLRNTVTGDEISWGSTYETSEPVTIVPGLYDVYYQNVAAGTGAGMAITVPRNKRARIATAVDLTSSTTVNLDVDAVKADRTFRVNGVSVPDSSANGYGRLFLRNSVTGDEVEWGYTYTASQPVQVLAGTYEVFYELYAAGTGAGGAVTVPRNTRARISPAVNIASTSPIQLNVTAVAADRRFTVNGSAVTDSSANGYGDLFLRNTSTRDEVDWGSTYQEAYPRQVIAGTYDVYYKVSATGSGAGGVVVVPRNTNARITQGVTIASTAPVVLSVTAVTVDRTFKVNNVATSDPTANGYGNLFIRNLATGDEINWGQTHAASATRQIIAGTYDVFYEVFSAGTGAGGATTVPRNTRARVVASANLTTGTPLAINLTALKVDRVFKVNSAILTDTTINGYGELTIRTDAGDEIAWGTTYDASEPVQIIAGTYDVFYKNVGPGTGAGQAPMVPRNENARIAAAAQLTTSAPLDLNVTVLRVDRTVQVNGVPVPDTSVNGYGNVFLRNAAVQDELAWGTTYQSAMRVPILAGRYERAYELVSKGSGAGGATTVPQNKRARLTCVDVRP